jgi:hypothetical protein
LEIKMATDIDRIGIDHLMVADGAQAVGGKLYILGGGWDRIMLPEFPGTAQLPFYVVFSISVPYALTNRKINFGVSIHDSDGELVDEPAQGQLEQGRPPGLRPGTPQRIPFAAALNPLFPTPGRYVIRVTADGDPAGEAAIEVVPAIPAFPVVS